MPMDEELLVEAEEELNKENENENVTSVRDKKISIEIMVASGMFVLIFMLIVFVVHCRLSAKRVNKLNDGMSDLSSMDELESPKEMGNVAKSKRSGKRD